MIDELIGFITGEMAFSGWTVFGSKERGNADKSITVSPYAGLGYQPQASWSQANIQIRARGKDDVETEGIAQSLQKFLVQQTGTIIRNIVVISSPFFLGQTDDDRSNWVLNLRISYSTKTL